MECALYLNLLPMNLVLTSPWSHLTCDFFFNRLSNEYHIVSKTTVTFVFKTFFTFLIYNYFIVVKFIANYITKLFSL